MHTPLNINLDYPTPGAYTADVVRIPKIYQGSPYDQTFRLRSKETGAYRDFSGYTDVRMQFVPMQGEAPVLTLSKEAGDIITTSTSLQLRFSGARTASMKIPIVSKTAINEQRLLHTIVLYQNGVEVERFAQGHAFIVAKITGAA